MKINLVALTILMLLGVTCQAANPDGTYRLLKDSDGTVPKTNAVVTITFKESSSDVSMKAVQPGETVTDTGKFSVNGTSITISFKEMAWEANRKPFSLDGCTLVLPFKALDGSEGQGRRPPGIE